MDVTRHAKRIGASANVKRLMRDPGISFSTVSLDSITGQIIASAGFPIPACFTKRNTLKSARALGDEQAETSFCLVLHIRKGTVSM